MHFHDKPKDHFHLGNKPEKDGEEDDQAQRAPTDPKKWFTTGETDPKEIWRR